MSAETTDAPKANATLALMFGVGGVMLALVPLIGLPLSIAATVTARRTAGGKAKAALCLGVLGVLLAVANVAAALYLMSRGTPS